MGRRKTVFTTGEVAKICNVAPRTVSKWFDGGHLRGYRIPGSKDRRIPVEHLVRFMRAHGIPLNGLDTGATRVLICDTEAEFAHAIRESLLAHEDFDVTTATNALECGAAIHQHKPNAIVVDVDRSGVDPAQLVRFVRTFDAAEPIHLIATGKELSYGRGEALMQCGFDAYLGKPFELAALIAILHEKATTAPTG